ncbi:MAG: phosphatase PAP2 family protein [Acidobacteria bacterium]|nr:phosphatase PAP2 family protein [Acidobacteriota bacterium]
MAGPRNWAPLDWIVAGYTAWIALLIVAFWDRFRTPGTLLAAHAGILVFLWGLPRRGGAWERPRRRETPVEIAVRFLLRFLRYTYPLLLALFFFEEAQQTVRVVYPDHPFWFETWLFAFDKAVFGAEPVQLLAPWSTPALDELMHALYFSYYVTICFGPIFAFFGPRREMPPAPGFETVMTALMTSYLLAYLWYPFLPARGPWEHPEAVGNLAPFHGYFFTDAIQSIIGAASVSGACFPSGHAAGAWGASFGLMRRYPRGGAVVAFITAGMSVACVYTRYHHAADVAAGFIMAVIGAWISWRLTPSPAEEARSAAGG